MKSRMFKGLHHRIKNVFEQISIPYWKVFWHMTKDGIDKIIGLKGAPIRYYAYLEAAYNLYLSSFTDCFPFYVLCL
jgi:hypothetical protein